MDVIEGKIILYSICLAVIVSLRKIALSGYSVKPMISDFKNAIKHIKNYKKDRKEKLNSEKREKIK